MGEWIMNIETDTEPCDSAVYNSFESARDAAICWLEKNLKAEKRYKVEIWEDLNEDID